MCARHWHVVSDGGITRSRAFPAIAKDPEQTSALCIASSGETMYVTPNLSHRSVRGVAAINALVLCLCVMLTDPPWQWSPHLHCWARKYHRQVIFTLLCLQYASNVQSYALLPIELMFMIFALIDPKKPRYTPQPTVLKELPPLWASPKPKKKCIIS
jgi:hypothetical protein